MIEVGAITLSKAQPCRNHDSHTHPPNTTKSLVPLSSLYLYLWRFQHPPKESRSRFEARPIPHHQGKPAATVRQYSPRRDHSRPWGKKTSVGGLQHVVCTCYKGPLHPNMPISPSLTLHQGSTPIRRPSLFCSKCLRSVVFLRAGLVFHNAHDTWKVCNHI